MADLPHCLLDYVFNCLKMSLQWTLVAGFLYGEIAVVILLMLPFISATMWQKLFKSRFLRSLAAYSNFYFSAFFVILLLLFLDSIRQMQKYSVARDQEQDHGHLDAELQQSMKMFRAQRNCYIAGFALFLAPVIRRLVSLLSKQAELTAREVASLKQAQSATETAKNLMKERDQKDQLESKENKQNEEFEKKIKNLEEQLNEKETRLIKTQKDLETLRSQAEGTNREYDRLLKEHEKLQKELEKGSGDSEKKNE
ncbi:b-cell receptor-associated protein 31 [Trichonephila clavata]|uniref:Endoplasmic reticulum transmembrane protein n=1 Tax=Trichonephila clavata TaxID=2740835 RepID=A0A8X6F0V9_TRICU|nr:b-cell receptor-associated protein 31 [Trichonephila clavata]